MFLACIFALGIDYFLYDKYVTLPANGEEARGWAGEYAMAGYDGQLPLLILLLVIT